MNSYFEQSGFYGSHHHQGGAGEQAAYRGFPLGLGMGAYGAQHALQRPQESPYDASVAAACKLYAAEPQAPTYKPDCSKDGGQNGYSDKSWAGARPAACTPDARAYGPPLEPASPGGGASARPAAALAPWNTQCSLGGSAQPVPTQLHQQTANHTFYPWMAIAGQIHEHFSVAVPCDVQKVFSVHGILVRSTMCVSFVMLGIVRVSIGKPVKSLTVSTSWKSRVKSLH